MAVLLRDDLEAMPGGETLGSLRSRILLGLLAEDEAERHGITLSRAELDATMRWFRERHDMLAREDVLDFLRYADLDLRELTAQVRTFATIPAVASLHHDRVRRELTDYRALLHIHSHAHDWKRRGTRP